MFCELEDDQKTFEYMKVYLDEWHLHHDLSNLDKQITQHEIQDHLLLHMTDMEHRTEEVIRWIKDNGQPFRAYLNTIKIAILAYHIAGRDVKNLTWNDFCDVRARLNEVKEDLLDTVMVEKVHNQSLCALCTFAMS